MRGGDRFRRLAAYRPSPRAFPSRAPWPLLFLAGALPLLAQENPAGAPEAEFQLIIDLLNTKVTTSTQLGTSIQRAPSTIYRYTGDELRRWGMRRLADMVNYLVPGAVITEDADENIAAFRGVATDNNCKVMVLINGHAINPQWAKGATPELELGMLEDIDSVEVIVGPGSALYGSGATVGVINLLTRRYDGTASSSSSLTLGKGNLAKGDTTASFPLGKDTSMTVSAGLAHAKGVPRPDGSASGNWPEYIQRSPLNARAFVEVVSGATEVAARFTRVSRSLYNTPVTTPTTVAPVEYMDYFYIEGQRSLPLAANLEMRVSAHYDAHQSNRYDLLRGFQTRALGEAHTGGKAAFFWTGERANLVTGVEYRYDTFGSDWTGNNFNLGAKLQPDGSITGLQPTYESRIITPYHRNFYGAYAQIVTQVLDNLSILGGLRYDYVGAPRIQEHAALTPRLGLVGTPSPKLTWKLMYTTGFRQAMAILTTPDGYLLGNKAFSSAGVTKPERIASLEGSVSYLWTPQFNVSLNLYKNHMENVHSLIANNTFVSAGKIDFVGGELILWYKLKESLNLRLVQQRAQVGQSRQDDSHALLNPLDSGQLLYYPQDATKFLVDWQATPWLSANTSGLRVVQQRGFAGSAPAHSGAYHLVNANAVLTWSRGKSFALGGQNLTNARPKVPMPGAQGIGTNMVPLAGRTWVATLRIAY